MLRDFLTETYGVKLTVAVFEDDRMLRGVENVEGTGVTVGLVVPLSGADCREVRLFAARWEASKTGAE